MKSSKKVAKINVIRTPDKPNLKAVPKLLKLHLGAGDRPMEGAINVDIVKLPGIQQQADLKKFPWPWKDGSAEAISAFHFYEHFERSARVKFIQECYRILADGGTVELVFPHHNSDRYIQDLTHEWPPIPPQQFLYFSKRWLIENKLDKVAPYRDYKVNFEFVYGFGTNPAFVSRTDEQRQFASNHYCNAVDDTQIKLFKVGPSNEGMTPEQIMAASQKK